MAAPAPPGLFDAHCHLQLPRLLPHAAGAVAAARAAGVVRAAVCGCSRGDWGEVEKLATAFPEFVAPQFGVHPWWAAEHEGPGAAAAAEGWVERLEAFLRRHPSAGVGECGLDKAKKKEIPMDVQVSVLRPQLELARELARPVSLHCVGAHGTLLEELARAFGPGGHGPGLVLHSYCGSADMIVPFARLNCFFSFSASFLRVPKHATALRAAPRERLLLETDSPDQLPPGLCGVCGVDAPPPPEREPASGVRRDSGGEPLNEPAHLPVIAAGAARELGVPPRELVSLTAANTARVFGWQRGDAETAWQRASEDEPDKAIGLISCCCPSRCGNTVGNTCGRQKKRMTRSKCERPPKAEWNQMQQRGMGIRRRSAGSARRPRAGPPLGELKYVA
ncbi:unnamed protein product [Prorocentrum cordatum]|uniref:TatD related DNase n=1 Tax=Prorocentrum cordatum TaxID=2364126 RepID=A0ABN9X472_9DINO|nr:unnamed protein product [Polarella glacialis]